MNNPMAKLDHAFDPLFVAHSQYMFTVKDQPVYFSVDPILRLKEFATLRMGFGRQNGKSSYISRTAAHDDIIYCVSGEEMDRMAKRCLTISGSLAPRVDTSDSRITHDRSFKNIWIDDASYVDKEDLDWLYLHHLGKCERFILIG